MRSIIATFLISTSLHAWSQHNNPVISRSTLESMIYHPAPQKLHHRIRITIRVNGSEDLSDLIAGCDGLSDMVEEVMSDIDNVQDVQDLVAYNIRLSFRTKDRRYKIYIGENRMLLNGNAYYMGVRIKI